MSVTQRDFIAISLIIRSVDEPTPRETLDVLALRLADYFAAENPRFDRARFLASAVDMTRHTREAAKP